MDNWIQHASPLCLPAKPRMPASVDLLFIGLLASSFLVLALLFFLLLRFAIHYRAGNANADRDHRIKKSWTGRRPGRRRRWLHSSACSSGARSFISTSTMRRKDAQPVYVVAKQWMWKVQHLGGQREINELHIPVGHAVRLIMSSQDVIHSFFIPAFRVKHDVVPGTTEKIWFRPRKARRIPSVLRGILRHRPFRA